MKNVKPPGRVLAWSPQARRGLLARSHPSSVQRCFRLPNSISRGNSRTRVVKCPSQGVLSIDSSPSFSLYQ